MPIISKEAAQRHLDMWMEAEAAVSTGQSYQIEQDGTRENILYKKATDLMK